MKNILILREKKNDYFLGYIKNANIDSIYINAYGRNKILTRLCAKFKVNSFGIFLGNWKRNIKKYDIIIIFDNKFEIGVSKYIKRKNPNCKIIFYFWNNINNFNKYALKDSNIDEFYTYSQADAKKYNIKYNSQFYTKDIKLKSDDLKYDITFLGRNKNRKSIILQIEQQLNKLGIKTNFTVIGEEKKCISYKEYLKKIEKSKAMLDIIEDTQYPALTLRVLESLFFEKKLVTNNEDIKNYAIYNPNNIFIVKENNITDIIKFLEKPYISLKPEIIDYYDFKNWIKRFID